MSTIIFDFRTLVVRLGAMLPYMGIVVVVVGLLIGLGMGKVDLALSGLYLAVPIVIAGIWLLTRGRRVHVVAADEDRQLITLGEPRFVQLALLNGVIILASLAVLLTSETRPLGCFVLMAAFSGVLFTQILSMSSDSLWQKRVILCELMFLSLLQNKYRFSG